MQQQGSMVKNAPSPGRPSRWSTKVYILAALAGILAATVVVIVVSAVLSPAELYFSITGASSSSWGPGGGGRQLHLTLAANNTSHRAGVHYRSFIVYLQYTKAQEYKIPADVSAPPCNCQPPWSRANMTVTAYIGEDVWSSDFDTGRRNGSTAAGARGGVILIRVRVMTVARFSYGRVYTRPYSISVSCEPVAYFSTPSFPVKCTG